MWRRFSSAPAPTAAGHMGHGASEKRLRAQPLMPEAEAAATGPGLSGGAEIGVASKYDTQRIDQRRHHKQRAGQNIPAAENATRGEGRTRQELAGRITQDQCRRQHRAPCVHARAAGIHTRLCHSRGCFCPRRSGRAQAPSSKRGIRRERARASWAEALDQTWSRQQKRPIQAQLPFSGAPGQAAEGQAQPQQEARGSNCSKGSSRRPRG